MDFSVIDGPPAEIILFCIFRRRGPGETGKRRGKTPAAPIAKIDRGAVLIVD